jgi:predicted ester cyclase
VTTDEMKALTRRFFDDVLTGRHLDVLDEILAPDFVEHPGTPGQEPGLEGARRVLEQLFATTPPLTYHVLHMIAEDDHVATRWQATVGPDGPVVATGILIDRFRDGKVVETWMETTRATG